MKNVLLVYLMLCLFFPIEIKAEKKPFGNGLYWELNSSGVLTISGTGAMPDADYNGSPWSKSGPIKKVIIQHGITSIGNDSFKEDYNGNHSLLSVEIPSSVKVIGDDAFSGCKRLSSVSIPNSVTTIGEGAFFSCERLTSITIPNSVNSIGDNAFLATGLSSIVIPNSVKSIGEAAFAECINLKNISISESVISIGDDAFIGDEDDKCYEGTISLIPQWLIDKGTSEWRRCGLSAKSVEAFKRTNTPDAIIKRKGGYASVVELKNGNTKYYKVSKGGRYGLTDAEGKVIVPTEMEALESAGTGYLKYKLNGFWGVMNYAGKIIIDTDRGYTSIGDFVTFTKRFPYTMTGFKGECDINGKEISKIKVETPPQQPVVVSNTPSTVASFYSNDLKTYDLRGNVKKCTWKGNFVDADYLPIIKYSNGESISNFTQDGTLQIKNYEIIRDSNGRITKLASELSLYYELSYDEKGRLVKLKRALPQLERLADFYYYSYDSSDRIIAITYKSFGEESDEPSFRFEYTQSDSNGNWIKRIAKSQLGNITQTREIEYY